MYMGHIGDDAPYLLFDLSLTNAIRFLIEDIITLLAPD